MTTTPQQERDGDRACPLCGQRSAMSDLTGFKDRLRIVGDLQAQLADAIRRAEAIAKVDQASDGQWPMGA